MNNGDNAILTESVIVTGSFGSEYLLKGTKMIFVGEQNGIAEVRTRDDTYFIPVASIGSDMSEAA